MWTQDEDGAAGFRRVLATVSHEEPFLVAVQWSGYPGGAIEATFEHPFYVEGKGWVAAAELTAGDLVVTAEGGWREVEGVAFGVGPARVHNLTVEEKHTFFVGEEGAWVHTCPTASGGGTAVFKWRPRGGANHVTVEILDGSGASLGEFHQFIDGGITGVERVGSDVARVRGSRYSVPLSDPNAAVGEAQRLIDWGDLGEWDRATNSCIHQACNIANAGGAGLPTNPAAQTAYVYRNLILGN